MYKWFFIAYLTCVLAQNEEVYTFDEGEAKLAECIKGELVNFDNQYESSQTANETAYHIARRFHGKSMSIKSFRNRMHRLIYDLHKGFLKSSIEKGQLSKQLRKALYHALDVCANNSFNKKKVTTQNEEVISFSQNRSFLSECIERHLKLTGHTEFIQQDKLTKFIADYTAGRYQSRSMSNQDFHKRYVHFHYDIRRKKEFHDVSTGKLSRELLLAIKQAVEDCAVGKLPLAAVPTFENEPPRMTHILDLILVKWPNDLYHMIQSRNGRTILRRYANDALAALMSELNVFHNDTQMFRLTLRSFWKIRAEKMYDGNSIELPYIVHQYTFKYPNPHMVQSDLDKFINRNSINFMKRNPAVPDSLLHEILNIFRLNNPCDNNDVDICIDNYIRKSMTSSEYYFENQLSQFYRVLFFIMELQARRIHTDEEDVYNGPLPNDLIPEHIQAIIYDDNVYSNYLLHKKLFFERQMNFNNAQNEVSQNSLGNAPVLEENLILLMLNAPSTSGIQSRSESVTTVATIITTEQSLKRKDEVWKNEKGKCFPKRVKTATVADSSCTDVNMGTEGSDVTISILTEDSKFSAADFTEEDSSILL